MLYNRHRSDSTFPPNLFKRTEVTQNRSKPAEWQPPSGSEGRSPRQNHQKQNFVRSQQRYSRSICRLWTRTQIESDIRSTKIDMRTRNDSREVSRLISCRVDPITHRRRERLRGPYFFHLVPLNPSNSLPTVSAILFRFVANTQAQTHVCLAHEQRLPDSCQSCSVSTRRIKSEPNPDTQKF